MQQQYADRLQLQPIHPGLEALDDGFFMVDANWRITYWNAAAEHILGIRRGAIVGQKLWTALPFFEESTSRDMLRMATANSIPQRYLDFLPNHPAGILSINAAPVGDGGLAVHFRDATEEVKQAEQYSALLETIQDGFVAVDSNWRIVYINSVAESLLRLRRERARNVSLWSFMPREPAEIAECLRATMLDGLKRHLSGVRPEGRVFRGKVYDLWTYPLAGGGVSILFEDVSDRVAREDELERLATEAREANRAKGRFYAAISHELRTPLNAIVGYTHLLGTGTYGPLSDDARRAADRAAVCAEHLARLVDDLLLLTASEVSRLSLNISTIDLSRLVHATAELYRLQAESKGLDFVLDVPDDLPAVDTDPERLRQILVSLLTNAVKYTKHGRIELSVAISGEHAEIAVTDTGPGIEAGDRERIFGAFEQVGDSARSNPLVRGSGLGLTVARQLAVLLQGTLALEESACQGSRFCLRLPLARVQHDSLGTPGPT